MRRGTKGTFTKTGIVCLALLLSLGAMGASYAAWSDSLVVISTVYRSANFEDPFSWVVSNDDGVPDAVSPYGVIDPGDDSSDPSEPQTVKTPCAREDIDVASTTADLIDQFNITITLSNAYPCYWPTIFYGIENRGDVPAKVTSIQVDENALTDVLDDIPELTVTVTGIYACQTEIDAGQEVIGDLDIHVEQSAAQCATYTIRVMIVTAPYCVHDECGECEGKVTQLTLRYNGNGSEAAYIEVKQKKNGTVFADNVLPGATFTFNGTDKKGKDDKSTLGTEISIYVDGELNTNIHTSCSEDIGPGLVSGAFEVVEGYSQHGGLLCPIPPPTDGGECKGKVTQLTLQYNGNGSEAAYIEVEQKVEQKKEETVFADNVLPGDTFTFNGQDKKGTLGTEISIYVDGNFDTKIHTSCSQDIGPGLVSGAFEVVEGYSKDGGKLAPIP